MTTYYYIDGFKTDETDTKLIDLLIRGGALVEEEDAHDSDDCDHDECHPDDGSECDHDYCHDECISEDYHSEMVEEARNEGYEVGTEAGKEEAQEGVDEEHYDKGFKDGKARSMKTFEDISSATWYLFEPKEGEHANSYYQKEESRLGTNLPPGSYYMVSVNVKVEYE